MVRPERGFAAPLPVPHLAGRVPHSAIVPRASSRAFMLHGFSGDSSNAAQCTGVVCATDVGNAQPPSLTSSLVTSPRIHYRAPAATCAGYPGWIDRQDGVRDHRPSCPSLTEVATVNRVGHALFGNVLRPAQASTLWGRPGHQCVVSSRDLGSDSATALGWSMSWYGLTVSVSPVPSRRCE